ncbi:hypothetical protein HGM15179_006770 [Zosterops borbonicus]|uniref:Uncharacterized protein n=1 Tax=Zosterops borbonicus TaxID=364589 RepID=A0A8K1GLT6_9PASS|nr:hypothetical protein HGM15179_006770 [Zosterops borbonicus]
MLLPRNTGYLCNAQSDETQSLPAMTGTFGNTITGIPLTTPTARDGDDYGLHKSDYAPYESDHFPDMSDHVPAERSLPTVVLAGVSIALVLLFVLIVGIFWYAWKKSQEGSMVLNPIPYGEAGVSLQNPSVPGILQEWPSERAVP